MTDLFLAIFLSSLIFVLFKVFPLFKIDTFQAIVFNYISAFLCGYILYGSDLKEEAWENTNWIFYAVLAALLFISLFVLMGKSAQKNGMAITSVAVKMSMAVSVLGMVFIYNEQLPFLKIIAILLAFSGVILVSFSKKSSDSKQQTLWMLLILFFGSGILDLLLNYVQKTQVDVISTALFSAFGFGIAGLIGLGILIAQIIRRKTRIEFRNVIGGVILGVPNFFSIFLLMRAYNSVTWSDSSVLAVINVAVVCISTLFGTLIFSEKISWAKGLGLCCSLLAIYLFYLVN
ncbi:MAG: DMT family transporter [Crocinitomicaceae bacterium]|nr:DMT family transporter [Flavobacteriia bacterium]NDC28811.1 DMT family transporter [Crocinitomicaceae bacterium]NDC93062.1 DMT family transporter [Flavobacteriales bacterium]